MVDYCPAHTTTVHDGSTCPENLLRLKNDFLMRLAPFLQHKPTCAFLEAMWHFGRCDCGMHAILLEIPEKVWELLPPVLERDRKWLRENPPPPPTKEE